MHAQNPGNIRDVAPGGGVLVAKADGSVATWGRSAAGMIQVPATMGLPGKVLRAAVGGSNLGSYTGYALLEDGTVISWGANDEGQLGNGTAGASVALGTHPKPSPTPQVVTGLSDIIDIDAGDKHALALRKDGTVWAWGWREYGVLGDGETPPKGSLRVLAAAAPIQVPGLRDIVGAKQLALGGGHVAVVLADGTVRMWGHNGYGQIGIGNTAGAYVVRPVRVPGLTDVAAVYLGNMRSYAVRTDGTFWAWGFQHLDRGILSKHLKVPTKLDLP